MAQKEDKDTNNKQFAWIDKLFCDKTKDFDFYFDLEKDEFTEDKSVQSKVTHWLRYTIACEQQWQINYQWSQDNLVFLTEESLARMHYKMDTYFIAKFEKDARYSSMSNVIRAVRIVAESKHRDKEEKKEKAKTKTKTKPN